MAFGQEVELGTFFLIIWFGIKNLTHKKNIITKIETKELKHQKYRNKQKKGCFCKYKDSAKQRKINFDLTFKQFIIFWQKDCYYCSDKIKTILIII